MENKDTLINLRENIDEIDSKIFSLLQERLAIVEQVGKFKKNNDSDKYIIRAGREALKVMKAYQLSIEAGYNKKISKAIANIWREIISLSINLEDPAKISLNKNNRDLKFLVREYMGNYSDIIFTNSDDEALNKLVNKTSNIAAFDISETNQSSPWWLELTNHNNLSIFAKTPLFDEPNFSYKLLVSNVTPEPFGSDIYFYVLNKKLPEEEKENFKIISSFQNHYLAITEEFYNKYQSKLDAKYIGCCAILKG